jgi:hypothetical protein
MRKTSHLAGRQPECVKDKLGWAGFPVRFVIAIPRQQALVSCAFSFCRAAGRPLPRLARCPRGG